MSFPPNKPLGRFLLLAAVGACPLAAQAGTGPYIGIEGGLNLVDNQNLKAYGFARTDDGTHVGQLEYDSGWLGGLTAGYTFDNGFRPELAITHRRNSIQRLQLTTPRLIGSTTVDTTDVSGYAMTDTAMFNLWYELPLSSQIKPYIGGGAGAARVAINDGRYDNNELRNQFDTVFAWQAGAGFAFHFTEHVTASLDYRFLQTNHGDFDLREDVAGTHLRARYRANSVQFGLRYSFGEKEAPAPEPVVEPVAVVPVEQAAPPPPPPPPPCEVPTDGAPVSFEGCKLGDTLVLRGVNFEFDKATLTLNAKALLDQVASALQQRADIKVEVDGYTDSKGSDAYNQKLSEQRATSVKDYLVERGIATDRMTTAGFGEASPVADNDTDEGRERNRRVELKVTEASDAVSVAPASDASEMAPTSDAGAMAPATDSGVTEPANGGDAPDLSEVDNAAAPDATTAPADADVPEAPLPDAVGPENGGQ
ncbi:MAG TPA: OmpA family protein [Solimonas sp.]|nr:OmpA family protein [Solimonas sp.]